MHCFSQPPKQLRPSFLHWCLTQPKCGDATFDFFALPPPFSGGVTIPTRSIISSGLDFQVDTICSKSLISVSLGLEKSENERYWSNSSSELPTTLRMSRHDFNTYSARSRDLAGPYNAKFAPRDRKKSEKVDKFRFWANRRHGHP